MSKQPNGSGSVRTKPRADGRWEGRYTQEVEGRITRRSVFGRTRQEAAQRLREALAGRDAGARPAPARETVGSYLETWITGAEPTLRPRTVASYRSAIALYLKPQLGRVPLARLSAPQVARFYADLQARGLSAKTVRNTHGILHRALQQAVRWRLLMVNVADLVDPPRREPREMLALGPDEVRQVLVAAREDELEALWTLALTAGLRQGELLALQWRDVDLDGASLRVVASMVRIPGQEPVRAEPKSSRSRRRVELSDGATTALRRHRQAHPSIYVFAREDGRPLSTTMVWKHWQRLLRRAGVRPVRFHDARHTAATLLLGRGVHPKIVSEMLGHATVAITLDVYSHATPAMSREAARVMDDLFAADSR